ncbi:uncharacterized protein LOC133782729 [Humulus lupulus]|uniref:uncharacterized protein LOC133782729 n=1 Tax=Humulus lupulus TaxID=3486 RepID=UPI002B40311A|nr:uncharacterized protein LOC133782729 [Humulus lupulus]
MLPRGVPSISLLLTVLCSLLTSLLSLHTVYFRPPISIGLSLTLNVGIFLSADMPVERAFDLYTKLASKKKSHRRQSGEGCSNQPAKKSQTDDPPTSTPTRETTPPPAPTREATPLTPTNPDLPSLVGQTPPPAPVDPTPPTSTVQQSAGHREEASGDDLTGMVLSSAKDRLSKITKHRRSREAIQVASSMGVD